MIPNFFEKSKHIIVWYLKSILSPYTFFARPCKDTQVPCDPDKTSLNSMWGAYNNVARLLFVTGRMSYIVN